MVQAGRQNPLFTTDDRIDFIENHISTCSVSDKDELEQKIITAQKNQNQQTDK